MSNQASRQRATARWRGVEDYFAALTNGGTPSEPRDPAISADGSRVACTVGLRADLESAARTAVLVTAADGSGTPTLVQYDLDLRRPRFAPVGDRLAVIAGDGVALVDGGEVRPLPALDGLAEHIAWSPDGARLLAVVADPGADAAGAQGSGRLSSGEPDWFPHVMADQPLGGWRRVHVIDVDDPVAWRVVSPDGTTVWEAEWCGGDRIVAVTSSSPEEAAWFAAAATVIDVGSATAVSGFLPPDGRCIGLPVGHPDGDRFAVVTATCSDRTVVAGDVTVVDIATGHAAELRLGIDVTWLAWLSADRLLVVGQRGLETVVAEADVPTGGVRDRWASTDLTCGLRYPEAAVSASGACALVVEGYATRPELSVLDPSAAAPVPVTRFAGDTAAVTASVGRSSVVSWLAPDGAAIEGLLAAPDGDGPFPVVTYVHGGPVWAWRNRWSMGYPYTHLLVRAGFAVFHPNPRGSTGRGEAFRAMVIGDLGGAESLDILSGLDHLVATGVADPARLGVLGGSHGGFMAAQLVTLTDRFAAAVPYAPVTHWPSMCLTTNDVAAQDRLVGDGAPSPLDAVDRVTTPTLVITGSRDLITPASQGLMFHRALALRGVPTQYAEYPLEGHGVRAFPANIDFSVRVIDWFDRWLNGSGG